MREIGLVIDVMLRRNRSSRQLFEIAANALHIAQSAQCAQCALHIAQDVVLQIYSTNTINKYMQQHLSERTNRE